MTSLTQEVRPPPADLSRTRIVPGVARSGTIRSGHVGRLLDRHVGSALLQLIGSVRKKKDKPGRTRTIGLVVLGAIGDALIVSALAQDIQRELPGVRIIIFVSSSNRMVLPLLQSIDLSIVLPLGRPDRAVRSIREACPDILIDCNQWLRISSLYCALSGCYTVGFRTSGQSRHYAYDSAVDHLATRHELENYRALLGPLGITGRALPVVRVAEEVHEGLAALFPDDGAATGSAGLIVFHPWAGGRHARLKEWPTEHWVLLATALTRQGYHIVVTGGPMDAINVDHLIAAAAQRSVVCQAAGDLTLAQTAALLCRADVVVAVNTGIMHLAAAVGAKLVALHGPTNPMRWGPLSDRAMVVTPEGPAGGYLNLGFEFPTDPPDCMSTISVETVLSALRGVSDGA